MFIFENVQGEMYFVNDETLKFLDWFEGVEENLYKVYKIEVMEKSTGISHQVPAYMLDGFKSELIEGSVHYFESYSSRNEFYEEYKKEEDSMDATDKLLMQIKA